MSVDLKQRSIIENDIPTPEMRVQTWCNSCTKFETEHSSQLQTRIPPPWQNSMSGWDFGTILEPKSHLEKGWWDSGAKSVAITSKGRESKTPQSLLHVDGDIQTYKTTYSVTEMNNNMCYGTAGSLTTPQIE